MATIETKLDGAILTITTEGIGAVRIDPEKLTAAIRDAAMIHGLTQKICDAAAMSRNPDNGKPATAADKHARMVAVAERLLAGQWNAERKGGAVGGELFRAMRECFPKSPHVADAKVFSAHIAELAEKAGVTPSVVRDKLAATPAVKTVLDRMAAERSKGVDGDAILAGFDS